MPGRFAYGKWETAEGNTKRQNAAKMQKQCATGKCQRALCSGTFMRKRVVAVEALRVAKHVLVERFAHGRAGCTTGDAAKESAHQGAGHAAEQYASRAGKRAERCAGFRTGKRCSGTTGSAGGCADCAAGPFANVAGFEAGRAALGTGCHLKNRLVDGERRAGVWLLPLSATESRETGSPVDAVTVRNTEPE